MLELIRLPFHCSGQEGHNEVDRHSYLNQVAPILAGLGHGDERGHVEIAPALHFGVFCGVGLRGVPERSSDPWEWSQLARAVPGKPPPETLSRRTWTDASVPVLPTPRKRRRAGVGGYEKTLNSGASDAEGTGRRRDRGAAPDDLSRRSDEPSGSRRKSRSHPGRGGESPWLARRGYFTRASVSLGPSKSEGGVSTRKRSTLTVPSW